MKLDSVSRRYLKPYAKPQNVLMLEGKSIKEIISNCIMVMPVSTTSDVNNSSHGNMNMDSMNLSFSTTANNANRNHRNYSLVNITDYQSVQALATKALEIFDSKLKNIATNNTNKSNQSIFVTSLESGISQLNNSIRNKASPLDIMMIVHTQIHPNLLEIFDFEIREKLNVIF